MSTTSARHGLSNAASLVLGLVLASALLPSPRVRAQSLEGSDSAVDDMVAQELKSLSVAPKTVALPSDAASDMTVAIRSGDFGKGRRLAEAVFARSKVQSWRFYPFNEFMASIGRGGNDPKFLAGLNAWLAQEPKSEIGHLIRAKYHQRAGWAARTEGVSEAVPRRNMDEFLDDLRLAEQDAEAAVRLNPRDPGSHYVLLEILSGNGATPQMDAAFRAAIKIHPDFYELYRIRMFSLTPKWGGSVKALYDFVDLYAARAPDKSPLKLLYLQLYAYLVDAAWYDCQSMPRDRQQQCISTAMKLIASPDLGTQIKAALGLFKTSDAVQFNTALRPILERLVSTVGSGSDALGNLLQLAADAMGSDNRITDQPVRNSYVLDDITARVWAQIGNTGNAESKFKEALSDVEHTVFTDEAQKDVATAWILEDMTNFADRNNQYLNIIVYHDAEIAAGGSNFGDVPYMKCYAYYKLKHFKAAADECTRLIDGMGNYLQSHYWHAKAYEALKQWDASLADFAPVAEGTNNWFRVGAALDMSFIYGQKRDFSGELASLDGHPWLFDGSIQSKADLAVGYNNRCHALMKLGELRKALQDCTSSLKYDHIPDAYQKQQELIKLLSENPATGV